MDKVALISHPNCLLHDMSPNHPERPQRLEAIFAAIVAAGLDTVLKQELAPQATREQLALVHDADYIDDIFAKAPEHGMVILDPDTAMNPFTLNAALHAAGAVVKAVDLVMTKQANAAFCNVRPPGHHAERARAMGFCIFNNVAVGVAHALKQYNLKRIAIVDFDVHHGNGTEDIFQNNQKVLLCSTYEELLYPFSDTAGTESIIKIPLPAGSTGREFRSEFLMNGFDQIKNFAPQLIFFSAGFDGHQEDMLANLRLTEFDYAWITRQVKQIAEECCQGRIVSVLEGGYALDALGRSVVAHIKALLEP